MEILGFRWRILHHVLRGELLNSSSGGYNRSRAAEPHCQFERRAEYKPDGLNRLYRDRSTRFPIVAPHGTGRGFVSRYVSL